MQSVLELKGKCLVHDSTNPHYVVGADVVEAEREFTNSAPCRLVTNPLHHNDIEILVTGEKAIRFVQTVDLSGLASRIRD